MSILAQRAAGAICAMFGTLDHYRADIEAVIDHAIAADATPVRPDVSELVEALKEFMDIWGSRDANSQSKRAQRRRAAMWDKATAAIANWEASRG